jgi:hypothetical protein
MYFLLCPDTESADLSTCGRTSPIRLVLQYSSLDWQIDQLRCPTLNQPARLIPSLPNGSDSETVPKIDHGHEAVKLHQVEGLFSHVPTPRSCWNSKQKKYPCFRYSFPYNLSAIIFPRVRKDSDNGTSLGISLELHEVRRERITCRYSTTALQSLDHSQTSATRYCPTSRIVTAVPNHRNSDSRWIAGEKPHIIVGSLRDRPLAWAL